MIGNWDNKMRGNWDNSIWGNFKIKIREVTLRY